MATHDPRTDRTADLLERFCDLFFDAEWYLERYFGRSARPADPLRDYLETGRQLGRLPGPDFDPGICRRNMLRAGLAPEDLEAGYIERGWEHGVATRPSPVLGPRKYHRWDAAEEELFRRALRTRIAASDTPRSAGRASIIMPTANRAHVIARAIGSVLRQSHEDWQLIVIDDGSTDRTWETIRETVLREPRIVYVKQPASGVSAARNTGLELATGEFTFFLDSDNAWRPDFLEISLAFMQCTGTAAVYSGMRAHGDAEETLFFRGAPFCWQECHLLNYIDLNTFGHRFDDRTFRFDEDLSRLVDWDYILRLTRTVPACYLPFLGVDYDNGRSPDRISNSRYVRDHDIKPLRQRIRRKSPPARSVFRPGRKWWAYFLDTGSGPAQMPPAV